MGEVRTGFARIETRLDGLERSTSGLKATVITTGVFASLAIIAAILATLTYGQAWFGIGLTTRDVVRSTVAEVLAHQAQSRATPQKP